jgi:type III secretion protein J
MPASCGPYVEQFLVVSAAMRVLWIVAVALAIGCSTPIQHGLDETAANEVLTALERGGIEASKARDESNGEAFIISVPKFHAVRALQILQSLGLPRGRRAGFGEVYKQASLVPTPTEERARYLEALAGEIERTLETVDGVVTARVHLVLAEPDPLAVDGKPRVAAQAAVLLKVRPALASLREADVQKLVAGSVAGLLPEAVAVVVTPAADVPSQRAPALASVGPVNVDPASRTLLLGGLLGGLAIIATLAVLLLIAARRLAGLERRDRKEG